MRCAVFAGSSVANAGSSAWRWSAASACAWRSRIPPTSWLRTEAYELTLSEASPSWKSAESAERALLLSVPSRPLPGCFGLPRSSRTLFRSLVSEVRVESMSRVAEVTLPEIELSPALVLSSSSASSDFSWSARSALLLLQRLGRAVAELVGRGRQALRRVVERGAELVARLLALVGDALDGVGGEALRRRLVGLLGGLRERVVQLLLGDDVAVLDVADARAQRRQRRLRGLRVGRDEGQRLPVRRGDRSTPSPAGPSGPASRDLRSRSPAPTAWSSLPVSSAAATRVHASSCPVNRSASGVSHFAGGVRSLPSQDLSTRYARSVSACSDVSLPGLGPVPDRPAQRGRPGRRSARAGMRPSSGSPRPRRGRRRARRSARRASRRPR